MPQYHGLRRQKGGVNYVGVTYATGRFQPIGVSNPIARKKVYIIRENKSLW